MKEPAALGGGDRADAVSRSGTSLSFAELLRSQDNARRQSQNVAMVMLG
jgi:hypothetical protein